MATYDYLKTNITDEAQILRFVFDSAESQKTRNVHDLDDISNILSSVVSFLSNAEKNRPVAKYIGYLKDAFLVHSAQRFDIKGKRYIGSPLKFYFTDPGLRNSRLNFRQFEETHLMENVIYAKLLFRGWRDCEIFRKESKRMSGSKKT